MEAETILYVPLEKIQANANIRKQFDEEELHGLMESLVANGQLQPVRGLAGTAIHSCWSMASGGCAPPRWPAGSNWR